LPLVIINFSRSVLDLPRRIPTCAPFDELVSEIVGC
jgi:hypothetical protein